MLKKNLLANYFGQVWTMVMNLAFIPIYIKYLGVEAFGLIGIYAVLQASLNVIDMGITPALSREMAKYSANPKAYKNIGDLLRSIEIVVVVIATTIILTTYIISDWASLHWIKDASIAPNEIADALRIMGLITALKFIEGVYRGCIMGLQKQVFYNVLSGVMTTVRSFGAVGVLAFISPTITTFFIWQGLITFATFLVLALSTYKLILRAGKTFRFSFSTLKNIRNFSGGIFFISLLSLLLMQSDKFVLSSVLSLENYGYYIFAANIAAGLYVFIIPVAQAWYPRFCVLHSQNNHKAISDDYHLGAQLVSVIAGSAAIVLFIFSNEFLQLWTQEVVLAATVAPILSLLILGNLLNGLMWIPYHLQLAFGCTSLTTKINLIAVLLFIPLILMIVPRYGVIGAAFGWIAINFFCMIFGIYLMHRKILAKELGLWVLRDTLLPIAAGLVASIAVYILFPSPKSIFERAIILSVAVLFTTVASAAAANLVRNGIMRYCRQMMFK